MTAVIVSEVEDRMNVLGLVCETHDAGIAVLRDGVPTSIIEEERLNREKHTREFPAQALSAVFGAGGIDIGDIDVVTTPWDMRRLRRSFARAVTGHLPYSLSLLLPSAQPTQEYGIVLLDFWLRHHLKRQFPGKRLPPVVNVGHHESHAAIYFVAPFDEAAVLVVDGYGDDAATSIFHGTGNRLARKWHGRFFDSVGMIYALVTRHLGFV